MARALLVGCGCRARGLGVQLRDEGWQVRGTTRDPGRAAEIEAAGIEPAVAEPDRVATVLDHVADVTVVGWLLASASGGPDSVRSLHGPRLERLCEELVDTPVRGIVYEAAGAVPAEVLAAGRGVLEAASERWRIPFEVIEHDPGDNDGWTRSASRAFAKLIAPAG
jgi:3-hydroxyisobutyrate dehydrogenase-like beta-hydroxyacid dehydrogenase